MDEGSTEVEVDCAFDRFAIALELDLQLTSACV